MKRSTDRVLKTHTGSLARPDDVLEMLRPLDAGQSIDKRAFEYAGNEEIPPSVAWAKLRALGEGPGWLANGCPHP